MSPLSCSSLWQTSSSILTSTIQPQPFDITEIYQRKVTSCTNTRWLRFISHVRYFGRSRPLRCKNLINDCLLYSSKSVTKCFYLLKDRYLIGSAASAKTRPIGLLRLGGLSSFSKHWFLVYSVWRQIWQSSVPFLSLSVEILATTYSLARVKSLLLCLTLTCQMFGSSFAESPAILLRFTHIKASYSPWKVLFLTILVFFDLLHTNMINQ